jgi:hypothetical protein
MVTFVAGGCAVAVERAEVAAGDWIVLAAGDRTLAAGEGGVSFWTRR